MRFSLFQTLRYYLFKVSSILLLTTYIFTIKMIVWILKPFRFLYSLTRYFCIAIILFLFKTTVINNILTFHSQTPLTSPRTESESGPKIEKKENRNTSIKYVTPTFSPG